MSDNNDIKAERALIEKKENLGCSLIIIGLLVLFLLGFITSDSQDALLIFSFLCLILVGVGFKKSVDKKKSELNRRQILLDRKAKEPMRQKIELMMEELKESVIIPDNNINVRCNKGLIQIEKDMNDKGITFKSGYSVVIWKDKDTVCFTYDLTKQFSSDVLEKFNGILPVFFIDNKDFLFYAREGDFYIKTDVSGGGTDYGDALVGGILFGAAGAIVASRRETETTTTEVDKRTTVLYYKYNNELVDAHFDKNAYIMLKNLFPAKDSTVIEKLSKLTPDNKEASVEDVDKSNDIYNKIEKLGDLRNKGYITEEEYNEKKKKLLDQI